MNKIKMEPLHKYASEGDIPANHFEEYQ